MRLTIALKRHVGHNYLRIAGVLAATLLLLNASHAWATAEEENLMSLDGFKTIATAQAPIQISEVPNTPYQVGSFSQANSQQIGVISGYIAGKNKSLAADEVNSIAQAIVDYSGRYGVDYRLVTSLISIESSFRRNAVSSSGAIGMGQLKPDTAKWLGVVDPYDPVDNIAGTTRFLGWLVRKYNGNLESALSAYYQGPGYVDRNGVTDVCIPYLEKINRALVGLI